MLAVATLVLGMVVVFMAAPAEATTASYNNPTTCSASVQNGVCIASVTADYDNSTVTVDMTVGKATDPTSDPNWLGDGFNTSVLWGLSTGGSATVAYVAEADSNFNAPGTFRGVVYSASSFATLCDSSSGVAVTFSLATNQYGLSFPASCIQSPSSISVQANWEYATSADSDGTIAAAPGTPQTFTTCCTVTPDATTTGSSTTTSTTSTSSTSSTTSSTSTTSTTTSTSTTTTSSTVAAVVSSPSSTGNTGSGSSPLAFTGPGEETPVLLAVGVGMLAVGILGRRRLVGVARRAKRSRVQ